MKKNPIFHIFSIFVLTGTACSNVDGAISSHDKVNETKVVDLKTNLVSKTLLTSELSNSEIIFSPDNKPIKTPSEEQPSQVSKIISEKAGSVKLDADLIKEIISALHNRAMKVTFDEAQLAYIQESSPPQELVFTLRQDQLDIITNSNSNGFGLRELFIAISTILAASSFLLTVYFKIKDRRRSVKDKCYDDVIFPPIHESLKKVVFKALNELRGEVDLELLYGEILLADINTLSDSFFILSETNPQSYDKLTNMISDLEDNLFSDDTNEVNPKQLFAKLFSDFINELEIIQHEDNLINKLRSYRSRFRVSNIYRERTRDSTST